MPRVRSLIYHQKRSPIHKINSASFQLSSIHFRHFHPLLTPHFLSGLTVTHRHCHSPFTVTVATSSLTQSLSQPKFVRHRVTHSLSLSLRLLVVAAAAGTQEIRCQPASQAIVRPLRVLPHVSYGYTRCGFRCFPRVWHSSSRTT